MKHAFLSAVRAASAAVAFALLPAAQAAPVSYTAGDLFLGVRAPTGAGSTQDYLVNIGQASIYRNATTPFVVTGLGDIGADLDLIFEEGWSDRADVFWSVFGTPGPEPAGGDLARTLYATTPEAAPYLRAAPLLRANSPAQAAPTNKLTSLSVAFRQTAGVPNQATTNSPVAIAQLAGGVNSYASFQTGGFSFSYFSPSIEGNFANGAAASVLELYRLEPAAGAEIGTAGDLLGTFTLNASGALTFVPKSFATLRLESAVYSISEEGTQLAVKVSRGGDLSAAVTASFTTTDDSAEAGLDYSTPSGTVSFAVGAKEAIVNIPIADRAGFQDNRSFGIALTNPSTGATIVAHAAATVTILESDPPPPGEIAFSAASYLLSSLNGSGNPNSLAVTINRTNGSAGAVSAEVSVTGGTLVNGTDYNTFTNPTVVNFADGQTSKTVTIQLKALIAAQLPGTIALGLANPAGGATLGAISAATINVVSAGIVSFGAATYQGVEDANGDTIVAISVSRTGGQTGAVSVIAAVTGGTATGGTDYTLPTPPITLNWADGEGGARSFNVTIKHNADVEGNETVQFTLQNAAGGIVIGTPGTTTLTILDADTTAPALTLTAPKAKAKFTAPSVEFSGNATDNQGVARVEISLNGGAAQSVTPASATTNFNWSLTLTPEQGANSAEIVAFDLQGNASAPVTREFTFTNLRPQFAGNYNGLVVADAAGTPIAHHGLVAVKVTPTGKFTGKVTLGSTTTALSGVFLTGGEARFDRALTPTLAVAGGELSLQLDTGAGEKITGSVRSGGQTRASIPHADRAPFTAQVKTVYTAVFQADANPSVGTSNFPQGDGQGKLTVDKKGVAKFVGKLADGSAVSYSNALSRTAEWPVFVQLYKKAGFITGAVIFDANQANTDAEGTDLKWFKPAGLAKQKLYPAGWANGITTDFLASKYVAPVNPTTVLGIAGGAIEFAATDGGLNPAIAEDGTIDAKNKVTLTGANNVKVTFVKGTGALSGSFTHPVTGKKAKFSGVAFQKTNTATGYFLSLPQSGAIGIAPK